MDESVERRDDSDIGLAALEVGFRLPVQGENAGLFRSRGIGRHPDRTILSHELILVRSGELAMWEGERRFQVRSGESLVLWPGRPHGGADDYAPDLSYYWIHFHLRGGAGVRGGHVARLPQHTAVGRFDHLVALFRRFLEDQESGELRPAAADLLVLQMLLEVAGSPNSSRTCSPSAEALAGRVAEIVRTRFHEPIGTAAIADRLGGNPDYLGRIFKSVYGFGIVEAIHRRRIRHSCKLLIEGALNVDEIARACGFADPGYFRRVFRRNQGLTPLAYQALHARVHVNSE